MSNYFAVVIGMKSIPIPHWALLKSAPLVKNLASAYTLLVNQGEKF
jgi:hypothetical protein